MKQLSTTALLAASIVLGSSSAAQAHNPEEFAAECAAKVQQTVSRVKAAVSEEVRRCVPRIKRLKAAGKHVEAARLARKCTKRINTLTRNAHNHVKEICTRCIAQLEDWGEMELAARVRAHCAEALEQIERINKRARRAIRRALN